jgi:hypothetical protein
MSSSASLTTEEKIRKATVLPDSFLESVSLEDISNYYKQLLNYEEIQKNYIEHEKRLRDARFELVDSHNKNPEYLRVAKEFAQAAFDKFNHQQNQISSEKSFTQRFEKLLTQEPQNPILKALERNYMTNPARPLLEGFVEDAEAKADNINGAARAYRNALIATLVEFKEDELNTPGRILVARKYYHSIIMQCLREEMYKRFNDATHLNVNERKGIDDILQKLSALLSQDDPDGFARELRILANPEKFFNVTVGDKKVKVQILDEKLVEQTIRLNDVLMGNYHNFYQFEQSMMEFRNKRLYSYARATTFRSQSPLYYRLPDLTVEDLNSDHFHEINIKAGDQQGADRKQVIEQGYRDYQRTLRSVDLPRESQSEIDRYKAAISPVIDSVMQRNYDSQAMTACLDYLRDTQQLGDNVLRVVTAILMTVLKNDTVDRDFIDARVRKILTDEQTILGLMSKLNEYGMQQGDSHRELRRYINLMTERMPLPSALRAISLDEAEKKKFDKCINEIAVFVNDAAQIEAQKDALKNKAAVDKIPIAIDLPLMNLLRAQVLQAAQLYFNPPDKKGWYHSSHHPFAERQQVLAMIQQIFSPNVKTFLETVRPLLDFVKKDNGAHTNSFSTFLSYVLYDEGSPRGLFKMNLSDVLKFPLNQFYPNYSAADVLYRQTNNITAKDVADVTVHLQGYLPEHPAKGEVVSWVRGANRLGNVEHRNLVRQQMIANLAKIATTVQQCKSGEFIAGYRPPVQPRPL